MSKNPTVKKTPPKKKTKAPRKRSKKKNTRKAVMYQSREYTSMVETLQNVSSLSEISPYAWISYEDGGKHYQDVLAGKSFALREGLTKLSIKNEKSKFPQLDFTIECPTSLNTNTMDTRVDDLVIGKRLYVYYGYTHAHTRNGPFKISKKDVVYGEGKITVNISAKMGYKLGSTTSSNVISTDGFNLENIKDKSVLDVIAAMGGNKINKNDILFHEKIDLINAGSSKGQGTLANRLFYHSTALDLDVFYDTMTGEIRLQTPYMLDLKRKPLKLTYGFPNSNIKNITYTHQLPNRKGASKKKGSVGLTGGFTGGNAPADSEIMDVLEQGEIIGAGVVFKVGSLGNQAFRDEELVEAKKKLGPSQYYLHNPADSSVLYKLNPKTLKNEPAKMYMKFRKYKVPVRRLDSNLSQITQEQVISLSKKYYLIYVGKPFRDKNNNHKITIKVDAFFKNDPSKTKAKKNKTKVEKNNTHVAVATNTEGDTVRQWETRGTFSFDVLAELEKAFAIPVVNNIATFQEKALADIALNVSNQAKKGFSSMDVLKDKNKLTVRMVKHKGKFLYQVDVSGDKTKPEDNFGVSSTNASQSRSNTAPSHKKKKRRSVRQYEKKMDIDLSTGDFLLQVGGLIRIDSLNNSVNGVFTIYSVSHTIDTNGYHTRLSCAKSMSLKSSNSKNKKQSSTRVDAQDKKPRTVYVESVEKEVQEKPKFKSTRKNAQNEAQLMLGI